MHRSFPFALLGLAVLTGCSARTSLSTDDPDASTSTASGSSTPPMDCERDDRIHTSRQWLRALDVSSARSAVANASSMVTDGHDRIVLSAVVEHDLTIDCLDLPRIGDADVLVATFEADGTLAWARRFGSPGVAVDRVFVGVDAANDVVLLGQGKQGSLDFGRGAVPSALFIASFDRNGEPRYARGFAHTALPILTEAAVTPGGDLAAIGNLQGDMTIDGVTLHGGEDNTTANLVLIWNSGGGLRHASATLDGPSYQHIAAASDGSLAATWVRSVDDTVQVGVDLLGVDGDSIGFIDLDGAAFGPITFDGDEMFGGFASPLSSFTGVGAYDVAHHTLEWESDLVSWEGMRHDQPPFVQQVAAAPGRVFTGWHLRGTADFGQGPVSSRGGFDAVVVAHDRQGNVVGTRRIGDAGDEYTAGIGALSDGRLALSLDTDHSIDLGFGIVDAGCGGNCDQLVFGAIEAP